MFSGTAAKKRDSPEEKTMSFVRIAASQALLTLFAFSGIYSVAQAQLAPVAPLQATTPLRSTTLGARAQATTGPTSNPYETTTQAFAAPPTSAPPPAGTAASNVAASPAYRENQWNLYNNNYNNNYYISTPYFPPGRLGYAPTQSTYGYAPDYGYAPIYRYVPTYGYADNSYRGDDYRGANIYFGAVLPGNGRVTTGRLFGYGLSTPMPPAATAFPPHMGMFPGSTATTPAGTAVPYGW